MVLLDYVNIGHMIYEMATGEILPEDQLLPNDNDFNKVAHERVKEILVFIFSQELQKISKKRNPMREVCRNDTCNS